MHYDEENGVIFVRKNLSLNDKIPDIVKGLIPDTYLNLLEESHYDIAKKINDFQVFPEGNKDKFLIHGVSTYRETGENQCEREYEIKINVSVPLIGGLIASQVGNSFKKSLVSDHEKIINTLSAKNK